MGAMSMIGYPLNGSSHITIASRELEGRDVITALNSSKKDVTLSRVSASLGHSRVHARQRHH
jgi:hypothetical protein